MDGHQKFLLGLVAAGVIGVSGAYAYFRHCDIEARDLAERSDVFAYRLVKSSLKSTTMELTDLEQKLKEMENLDLDLSAAQLRYSNLRAEQSILSTKRDELLDLTPVQEYRGLQDRMIYPVTGMVFFGTMAAFGFGAFIKDFIFHPIRGRRKSQPVPAQGES